MTIARYLNPAQLTYLRRCLLGWLVTLALYGALHSYMPFVNYAHIMTIFMGVAFGYGLYCFKED
jgi:hypothetical protein